MWTQLWTCLDHQLQHTNSSQKSVVPVDSMDQRETRPISKPTHFLLELIQNADDNKYEGLSPTLDITYSNRTLRIDCNEIGFGRRNVETICSVGASIKAGLGNSTRYIGEKGIGFKSVFKVAHTVWIKSSHYSFKFDRREKLGMIAPI